MTNIFASFETATHYNFIKNWNKVKPFLNNKKFKKLCNKMIRELSCDCDECYYKSNNINEVPLYNLGRYNEAREDELAVMIDNNIMN